MPEGFNLENWRKEDDPILDVETEDEKTVRENLQSVRDKKAEELRGIRKERDEKRKEAEVSRLEAQKFSNKILKYVRPEDHPLHPNILNDQAETRDKEADLLKNKAIDKDYSFSVEGEKREAEEMVDKKTIETLNLLQTMNSAIYAQNSGEFISILQSLPQDNIKRLIESGYKKKNQDKGISEIILSRLADIREEFRRDSSNSGGFTMRQSSNLYDEFVKNILVEEARNNEKAYKKIELFHLLRSVNYKTPQEEKDLIKKAIDNNLTEEMVEAIRYENNGYQILDALVYLESEVAIKIIKKKIESGLEPGADHQTSDFVFRLVWEFRDKPSIVSLIYEMVGKKLEEEFGISDGVGTVRRWRAKDVIKVHNIYSMRRIEKEVSGGVKLLHEAYGICEFQRYPEEILIEQIKMHNKDVPYGVVFYPEEDHNDAFDQDSRLLGDLYEDTKGKDSVKIFEISRKTSLMRYLVSLRLQYKNKIDFMIIGGHGGGDGLVFSDFSYLDKTILEKSTSIEAIKEMFVSEPSIALFSCSTGIEKGFAQMLSEKLNARVLAPKIPTHPKSLNVRYENGKPILDVTYGVNDKNQQAEYLRGK